MVFSSLPFLFGFMPLYFIAYFLTPEKYRNTILLGGSLIFYAIGTKDQPLYFFLLLLSMIINIVLAQKIQANPEQNSKISASVNAEVEKFSIDSCSL